MKRIALIIVAFIFTLTGCASVKADKETASISTETTVSIDNPQVTTTGPDNETTENVPSFSYEEINQIYKENDPGVKCDSFYNTSEAEVTTRQQVIDRAKNECTIEYDTIDVFYDNVADIWKVVFSTAGTLGGCQTVYLDNKGLTCLIIYGE